MSFKDFSKTSDKTQKTAEKSDKAAPAAGTPSKAVDGTKPTGKD